MSAKDIKRRANAKRKLATQKTVTFLEPGTGPVDFSGIEPSDQTRFSETIKARKVTKSDRDASGASTTYYEFMMASVDVETLTTTFGKVPGINWQIVDGTSLESDPVANVTAVRTVTGDELDVLHYFRADF